MSRSTPNPMQHIPLEIIFNILTRQSVKTLSRLKCVSKTWLSTISSPEFIKRHLQTPSPNRRVILGYNRERDGITFHTCSVKKYKPLGDEQPIKLQIQSYLQFVGSCNGLFCILTARDSIVLWNPSTRKSKCLPTLILENGFCNHVISHYSFIYDDFCDDYKVVHLQLLKPEEKIEVQVYSLRTNSWTEIHKYYYPTLTVIARSIYSVTVNGKNHWAELTNDHTWIIRSFDQKTESIGELRLPDDEDIINVKLDVHNGYLCLKQAVERNREDPHIWIMKEYGVHESWKKIVLCFKTADMVDFDLRSTELGSGNGIEDDFALTVLQEHRMFNRAKGGIMKYRPSYNVDGQKYVSMNVVSYIESLVSPTFDGDKDSM